MAYAIHHRGQVAAASGLDVLAAIWLIVSPFVMAFHSGTIIGNNVVMGIIIGVIALARFIGGRPNSAGLSWLNALLGIWVLVSPWALGFSGLSGPTSNNIAIGIVIIVLSCWSAMASASDRGMDVNNPTTGTDLR